MRFAADFETTTQSPVHVWLWAIAPIEQPDQVTTGETIEEFFEWMRSQPESPTIYFHNQKFDGMFILYHLLTHGFTWERTKGDCCGSEFTTIIGADGKFFSIDIYFERKRGRKVKKVTIFDSMKLLPMSIDKASKHFGLTVRKLKIDYDAHNKGGAVTAEEIDYIRHDVMILAQILSIMDGLGMNRVTIGACALADYRANTDYFHVKFPQLDFEVDQEMRNAFRGGWFYVNPENQNRDVGKGFSIDCNSMFGSMLRNHMMPWGTPLEFDGQYEENPRYPLYIQRMWVSFSIKPDKFPFIQIKGSPYFSPSDYAVNTLDDEGCDQLVELYLSTPDMELFFEQYDIHEIYYTGGWMFKGSDELFRDWVDKWSEVKAAAAQVGNKALRLVAKMIIANLYGKFATNPKRKAAQPIMDRKKNAVRFEPVRTPCTDQDGNPVYETNPVTGDVVTDENGQPVQLTTDFEIGQAVYIPVGIFTTAWSRWEIVRAAQRIHDKSKAETGKSRFCYAATDSLHLIGEEFPDFLEIDPLKTGAWKCDGVFTHGKYIGANRYVELMQDADGSEHLKVRCAGLPENVHDQVTFENFTPDAIYQGRLIPESCPGGVVLKKQSFHMNRKYRREGIIERGGYDYGH